LLLVSARLCEPSSELHIAEDWYRRTALSELLQLDETQVKKDRLYRALDELLLHKASLEAHLSQRCGQLFEIDNEVLLYDVTNTYFASARRSRAGAYPGVLSRLCAVEELGAVATARRAWQLPAHRARRIGAHPIPRRHLADHNAR